MAIVNKFNVNKQQVTLDADIIENMSANDVSYDSSTQYDENTVGDKLSELEKLKMIDGGSINYYKSARTNNNGEIISASASWSTTDKIELSKILNIETKGIELSANCAYSGSDGSVIFYDSSKMFVGSINNNTTKNSIPVSLIPNNAKYASFNFYDKPNVVIYGYSIKTVVDLNKKVDNLKDILIESPRWINGGYINLVGEINALATWQYTDYISIQQLMDFSITCHNGALGIALYDSYFNFITGVGGTDKGTQTTIPFSLGVVYVRFSHITTSDKNDFVNVRTGNNIVDKIAINSKSTNVGYINPTTHIVNDKATAYRYTQPIPVKSGTAYRYTYLPDAAFKYLVVVISTQEDGSFTNELEIVGISLVSAGQYNTAEFIVPEGVHYITLATLATSTNDVLQHIDKVTPSQELIKDVIASTYKSKIAYVLGDSIAQGLEAQGWSWSHWLANWGVFKKVVNCAKGGNEWFNVLNNELPALENEVATHGTPDFIFILCGTNDWASGRELGTWYVDSQVEGNTKHTLSTTNSTKGYINRVLSRLKSNYPLAKIVMMTPIRKDNNVARENGKVFQGDDLESISGKFLSEYRDLVLETPKIHNVWAFDTWGLSQLDPHNLSQKNSYWVGDYISQIDGSIRFDGVHPNRYGHKEIAKALLGYLLGTFTEFSDEKALVPSEYYQHTY